MNKYNQFAIIILGIMLLLMLGSMWNDSATFDEVAHIAAGFGNVDQLDYRLNPEHPPLVKALSALSAKLVVHPYFPTNIPSWQETVTEWQQQFKQGGIFLYQSGNDADRILFWGRFPVLLLSLLLGTLIYVWVSKRFSREAGILSLAFFAFSPTILAHSRYITTDIGAALGFFIGIVTFVQFLEVPTKKNIFVAGLAFGIAQLLKFSCVMLIPIYIVLFIAWVLSRPNLHFRERVKVFFRFATKTLVVGIIGVGVIWITYAVFTWNYPEGRQITETQAQLGSGGIRPLVNLDLALARNKFTRPLAHFTLGVLMANNRAAGGNTAYFLDTISSKGSHLYFPLLYVVKEQITFHILTLLALIFAIKKINFPSSEKFSRRIRLWIYNHFFEFSFLVVIVLYWTISIVSPLNIGIRHVLPTLPFIFMLVAITLSRWFRAHDNANPQSFFQWISNTLHYFVKAIPKYVFVGIAVVWMAINMFLVYPHFLSYYNTFAGGSEEGYKIATDSNYDWGQDFKRLVQYVDEQKIGSIAGDYFGGANPAYYLGSRYQSWWPSKGPVSGWFAISANVRQGAWGKIGPGFTRKPEDSYDWLKSYQPVARIGHSIFVYKIP